MNEMQSMMMMAEPSNATTRINNNITIDFVYGPSINNTIANIRWLRYIDFYYGHNIPALVFFLWFSWGVFNMFCRMHRQRLFGTPYLSTTSSMWLMTNGVPYEALIKTVVAAFTAFHYYYRGVTQIGSINQVTGEEVVHYYVRQLHHSLITASYVLHFACEAGVKGSGGGGPGRRRGWGCMRQYLPPHIEYYTLALGFFLQSVTFYFHLDDQGTFHVKMHYIQFTINALIMASVVAENALRQRVWMSMLRWHLMILLAYWLIVLETATKPSSLGLGAGVWHWRNNPWVMSKIGPVFVAANALAMFTTFGFSQLALFIVRFEWFDKMAMATNSIDGEIIVRAKKQPASLKGVRLNNEFGNEDDRLFVQ